MLNAYRPEAYAEYSDPVGIWRDIARRQAEKDWVLIPALFRHFYPNGSVLELGAGVGQLSQLMDDWGYRVVASDYHQFFVDYMLSIGLNAYRVDAMNIAAAGLGQFDNIFSQSITPLTTSDLDVVERTYISMRDSLRPGGHLVMIHAMCSWREIETQARRHMKIASRCGFEKVRAFRNQILPSRAYGLLPAWFTNGLEELLGRRWGTRFVLLAEKPVIPDSEVATANEEMTFERV